MNKEDVERIVEFKLARYNLEHSLSGRICNFYDNIILPFTVVIGGIVGLAVIPISLAYWLPIVVTLDAQSELGFIVSIIGFIIGTFIDFCLVELLSPENQIKIDKVGEQK